MFQDQKKTKKHLTPLKIILVLAFGGALAGLYFWPLPALYPASAFKASASPVSNVSLDWPGSGEAAIGAVGYGVLATGGQQTARPTASTAKLIDALTVLKKYPLQLGQSGPTITLSSADVAIYNKYVAEQGSVARVVAGETISEYQMLEAMMLPSANNMADSLAIWAFGSLNAYHSAATQEIISLGLSSTTIGSDASGFLPSTTSTAHDLVLVGEAAMQNPVLAQIVSKPTATIPVAGKVKNVDWLLGEDGIIGIKTGNSNQAGGVYVFANKYSAGSGGSITIVGTIQGLATLQKAMDAAIPLLNSAKQNFSYYSVAKAGQTVAHYKLPWGGWVSAVAAKDLGAYSWAGQHPNATPNLHAIYEPRASGTTVGILSTSKSNSTNVILSQKIPSPPWWWRFLRFKL